MSFHTIQDAMESGETLVFGHRGSMAYAPMNTLAAFELAYKQGAAGIELDVHRSKDGCPVVVHDFTVDETTNGKGAVSDKSLAELKTLDAGGWYSDDFAGEQMPTLDEVFESLGNKLLINIEVKSILPDDDGLVQVTADCIARHQMQTRVLVSSFNPHALQGFKRMLPDVMTGFLYLPEMSVDVKPLLLDPPHQARHPHHSMIDKTYMRWAKANHYYVNAWTVNSPERAKELKKLGVNAVITDHPDIIIAAFS